MQPTVEPLQSLDAASERAVGELMTHALVDVALVLASGHGEASWDRGRRASVPIKSHLTVASLRSQNVGSKDLCDLCRTYDAIRTSDYHFQANTLPLLNC